MGPQPLHSDLLVSNAYVQNRSSRDHGISCVVPSSIQSACPSLSDSAECLADLFN